MAINIKMIIACLFFLATLAISKAQTDCDVESSDCVCVMPKLYDCPEVQLSLNPVPDGCPLLREELSGPTFSNLTCGVNDTYSPLPSEGVNFIPTDGQSLEFVNNGCDDDFYFIVDLNGGQLVKTLRLEDKNPSVTSGEDVFFEFAYGYTVPCTDQPTINTLLWQYITPGWYAPNADITAVWNRLNFTDDLFEHNETTYFKAAYLFIHFNQVPRDSRFRLTMTGCHERAKDIAPALEYLNNLLSVSNDSLEIAEGITVSGPALADGHNLTTDEVVLFLDAFEQLGETPIDLSDQPEKAQNLTDGLAFVASQVITSISDITLPSIDSDSSHPSTPAGPYTPSANIETTNPDKKVADQQAEALLTIEKGIGAVTANAGNATIVVQTEEIIIVSAPLQVTNTTTTQTIDLSGGAPVDGSGGASSRATVEVEVDLSSIAKFLAGSSQNSGPNGSDVPAVRFTALQIKSDEFLDTQQNIDFNSSASAGEREKEVLSEVFLNTDILSLSIYVHGEAMSIPVETNYRNKQQTKSITSGSKRRSETSVCVWLTEEKAWSNEGCATNDTNDNDTDCSCSHTTSFAVLVQVVEFEIGKADVLAMTILSYFGICLSILCLVIALFIFFSVAALRVSERNMIHRNLMIALLLAYITFLAGVEYAKEIPIICTIVAALLHYLYLAVFGWMLIEGIHLYLMLVKVFGSEGSKQVYYLLIGWGAPVIIVAISVGIRHYEYGTSDMCWIKQGSSVIWAFVGPVIAIILFNFFVLCMVLRIIYRSSAISVDCPVDQVKAAAKGSIALLPILGLTWCLGIFALGQETIVFQYLFVICNSTQGILLFVFHCLLNSEVRNALKREQEKMGWSTAGTQSKKTKVHPEDTANVKSHTTKEGRTKTTNADEKSVAVYQSAQNMSGGKGAPGEAPKKTNSEFSLPGQIDDPLDEAQTSTIRQEIKTEREMEHGGWKINEKKHVQRTFVRVEDPL